MAGIHPAKSIMLMAVAGISAALLVDAAPVVKDGQDNSGCSPHVFGQALAVDEGSLTTQSVSLSGRSAEGSELTVLRHESEPRVLRVSDFGETGRAITSVYIVDSLTFIVWRTEYRYAGSIGADQRASIASSETSVRFFCRGAWYGGEQVDSSDALQLVRAAFKG